MGRCGFMSLMGLFSFKMKLLQLISVCFVSSLVINVSIEKRQVEQRGKGDRSDNQGNTGGNNGNNGNNNDNNGNNGGNTGNGGNRGNTGTGGNTGTSSTNPGASNGMFLVLMQLAILAAGGVMTAYASGKVLAVTENMVETVGGAGLGSIGSFIILYYQQFVPISELVQIIIILVAAGALGYMVFSKKNTTIGTFGLGAILGYVVGLLISLVLGTSLGGTIKPIFLLIIAGGFGYLVMNGQKPKFLIIASAIAGSFCLVYGLDSVIFKSGFSQIGTIALNSLPFPGFQDTITIVVYLLFVGIAGGCLYLQKDKITK